MLLLLSWLISNVVLALLLAVAAWLTQRWLMRPAVARILWVFVLIKLVTPPLVTVPLGQSPNSVTCALGTCGCDHHSGTQAFVRDMLPWALLAVWSVGTVATAWIAWRRWVRFQRLLEHASPPPPEWQSLAARLASDLSMRCPEILAVPGRLPPLVVPGRPRPRMLLPMALIGQLSSSQRTALLMHELVHLKRGDHLVRMLELAVGIAYWWLPIVGWIGRQLRACEETCCDEAVVTRLPEARRDYAELLLDVIDFANPMPVQTAQATAMSAADDLEKRLRAILDPNLEGTRTKLAGTFVVGLAFAILPCQLQLGFVSRSTPATNSAERGPDAQSTSLPGDDSNEKLPESCGCPS